MQPPVAIAVSPQVNQPQGAARQPRRSTSTGVLPFTRDNLPPVVALVLPASLTASVPVAIGALLAGAGLLPPAASRGALVGILSLVAFVAALGQFYSATRTDGPSSNWILDQVTRLSRRTGLVFLDLVGIFVCLACAIVFSTTPGPSTPWLVSLSVISLAGFAASAVMPVVPWPLGWRPAGPRPPEQAPSGGDTWVSQSFSWELERGMGAKRYLRGEFSLQIDVGRCEMVVASLAARATPSATWRARAEDSLVQGSTPEVTETAFRLAEMRRRDGLSEYEDLANILSFVHQAGDLTDTAQTFRPPVETLRTREGNSIDRSLLLSAVIRQLGRRAMLLYNPATMHMAVATPRAEGFQSQREFLKIDGESWFFLETTDRNWLPGEVPSEVRPDEYEKLEVPSLVRGRRSSSPQST